MFEFCSKELLLSEDDAYKLIRSARTANKRPAVLSYLAQGSLTTRTLAIIAPETTARDFPELMEEVMGKPIREVERIMAERRPDLTERNVTRVLRVAPETTIYRLSFNADQALKQLLDRLKALMSQASLRRAGKRAAGTASVLSRSPDNIRLLCRAHNQAEARRIFG